MGEKEHEINGTGSAEEGNPKPSDEREKIWKNRRNNRLLKEIAKTEEEREFNGESPPDEGNPKYNDEREKRKKLFLKEIAEAKEEQEINGESSQEEELSRAESGEKHMLAEAAKGEEEQGVNGMSPLEEENPQSSDRRTESRKKKRKERLLKEAAKANRRGVCYLSRIPPHMDHVKLRQILSQFGDIQRIYLAPEDPAARVHRKKAGGFRGQGFSEGWVEFTDKSVAKRVADMLNGEQIGGRKRSQFYYDLWNIKYLSKFKWDDLTEEIAYKNAIREQRLALEISAAKREGDFYRSKVDRSHALSFIEERMMKKQKVQQDSGTNSELPVSQQAVKVIRQFPQKKPVTDKAEQSNPRKDFLAGILRGSS